MKEAVCGVPNQLMLPSHSHPIISARLGKICAKINVQINATSTADIMLGFGNGAKAKKLLSKAFVSVQKCNNSQLKQEIVDRITSM